MSTQREVLQQALEAFESTNLDMHVAASDAIRAALAEPAPQQEVQEPVVWVLPMEAGPTPKQEVQEPVAWAYQWKQGNPISWYVTVARWHESDMWHEYPLYTAPQQEVREPVAWLPSSEWVACTKLPVTVHVRQQRPGETHVSTREGITPIKPDDLIIRGVAGEEYPIGKKIFEKTYRIGNTSPQPVQEHLSDERIEDLLGIANPTAEEKHLIRMGFNAARKEAA